MDELKSIEITFENIGINSIFNIQGYLYDTNGSKQYWKIFLYDSQTKKKIKLNSIYHIIDVISNNYIMMPVLSSYDLIFDDINILEENKN